MNENLILNIKDLKAGYTKGNYILNGLKLEIRQNEIIAIVGQNGAGKSTLAKAIMGLIPYTTGSLKFIDEELINRNYSSEKMYFKGISFFMQGGEVFRNLTVDENLQFAGRKLDKKKYGKKCKKVFSYFDLFEDNRKGKMKASFLSGGEQHQLALAMVLMQTPKLLILDEPSAGLSPLNRDKMFSAIEKVRNELNISILLIEQNVNEAVKISDKVGLLKLGKIDKLERKDKINKIDQFFWD